MSFIENLFRFKPEKNITKKKRCGKLKNASSCTDTRACSLDPAKRKQYFMDNFNVSSSSSSEDTQIPDSGYNSRSRRSRSVSSIEDVNRLKLQLLSADGKIAQLSSVNKKLRKRHLKCTSEVDNLRSLIKDLQDKMTHLEKLKVENLNMKTERGADFKTHILKAEDEIHHLKCEVEIFHDIKEKYEDLRHAHEQIKAEHSVLSRTLAVVKEEKRKLAVQCKFQKESLEQWKSKANNMLSVVTDKNLLRDKLNQKDDNIATLCESIASQEKCIQDLNDQLTKVSNEFESKQRALTKHIEALQFQLNQKTSQVTDLESQLAMSKLVVKELETLREQFRTTNTDLSQNVTVFKTQFLNVLDSSNQMVETIENLQKELEKKNHELEQSKFIPQTTKTKFYFSELNRLLNSPKLEAGIGDSVCLKDALVSIKSILNCLKRDLCVTIDNSSNVVQLWDSTSQTVISNEMHNSSAQTVYWDDHLSSYKLALKQIDQLSEQNISLSFCNKSQKEISDLLQKKVDFKLRDLKESDSIIIELKLSNARLYEHVRVLDGKLEYTDVLLEEAVYQIEFDSKLRIIFQEQFENMISSVKNEYEIYTRVLETFLECQQNNLDEFLSEDPKSEIDQLKQEITGLCLQLEEERIITSALEKELNSLSNEFKEKSHHINEIEDKLASTETIVDSFASELESGISLNLIKLPNNEIGYKLTMILNRYKENLIAELEVKKNWKDKKFSKKEIKKYLNVNKIQKIKLHQKILQMNTGMKRVKNTMCGLKNKLLISDNLIQELSTISELLTYENNFLKKTNADLINEIGGLKQEIKNMDVNLKTAETSKNELLEIKSKMEKMITSQIKKLAKYKKIIDKNKDADINDIADDKFIQLAKRIELLKAEKMSLLFEIKQLKSEKRDTQTVDAQVQEEKIQDVKDALNNVKQHYEAIIQTLQKENAIEKEQSQKEYAANIQMLQETFEKEKISLKRVHAEKILRIQSYHENEIASMKEEIESEKKKQEKQKNAFEAELEEEIQKLKNKYDTYLNQKEELFTAENEMLKIRLVKTILEKDSQLDRISSEMALNFQNFRNKCKINVQKLKQKHKADLDKLVEMCKHEVIKVIENEEKTKKRIDKEHHFGDHLNSKDERRASRKSIKRLNFE